MKEEKEMDETQEVKEEATEAKEVKETKKKKTEKEKLIEDARNIKGGEKDDVVEVIREGVALNKSIFLRLMKSYNYNEKDRKNLELMEAIKNATEDDLVLVEHKATVQLAHMELDVTCEGEKDITTRTINNQITSGSHIWLVDGDVRVAKMLELRNGYSQSPEDFIIRDENYKWSIIEDYIYKKGKETRAATKIMNGYAEDYFHKLNFYYRKNSSRVNSYEIVLDSDPVERSFWEVHLKYINSKGKEKKIPFGTYIQEDEGIICVVTPYETGLEARKTGLQKTWRIAKIIGGVLVAGAIIGFIIYKLIS